MNAERATFYFDLGSPYAYLTAERISGVFTDAELEQPEWQPVLLGGLFQKFGRDSWANGVGRADGIAEVERRAAGYGLPPLVWPDPWPGNYLFAMRVATFAKQTGRTVSFALAGFRQAFAAGRDLTEPENVMIAAAAISTLSCSLRSRPAANCWRKAARAKETLRPVCLAKVATRIAKSMLPGHGSGQASGARPYSPARRSTSAIPSSRSGPFPHESRPKR